jgi:hypothetical protein
VDRPSLDHRNEHLQFAFIDFDGVVCSSLESVSTLGVHERSAEWPDSEFILCLLQLSQQICIGALVIHECPVIG